MREPLTSHPENGNCRKTGITRAGPGRARREPSCKPARPPGSQYGGPSENPGEGYLRPSNPGYSFGGNEIRTLKRSPRPVFTAASSTVVQPGRRHKRPAAGEWAQEPGSVFESSRVQTSVPGRTGSGEGACARQLQFRTCLGVAKRVGLKRPSGKKGSGNEERRGTSQDFLWRVHDTRIPPLIVGWDDARCRLCLHKSGARPHAVGSQQRGVPDKADCGDSKGSRAARGWGQGAGDEQVGLRGLQGSKTTR